MLRGLPLLKELGWWSGHSWIHRPPRLPAPLVRARPAVLPRPTSLALLLPTPLMILYDAYVQVIMEVVHQMECDMMIMSACM
jgi:hypothetical protein